MSKVENNFAIGSVSKHIVNLAVPMIVAQLINVLYNVVDRVYIGRIPGEATLAMGGLGLCLPLISIINAFANLFGMGGAPLCSIARGRGDNDEAEKIMGNSFVLLIIFGILLMVVGLIFKEDLLWLFGASENTISYANDYMTIYLLGTIFVLIGLGMNSFINSQGFAKIGMMTVLLGAVMNIILDPIFIFVFDMGVQGAAIATVISQFVSAMWTFIFLTGEKTILKIKKSCLKLQFKYVSQIVSLGTAGFMMAITNSIVSIVCNATLSQYGGDLYIAIMTIINSLREVAQLPGQGIANACQPVLGYNYGARKYQRVLQGIRFVTITALAMMLVLWLAITVFPQLFIQIFSHNQEIITDGVRALRLYFFGFFMMAFQMVGQAVAVGLGKSRQAIFFSIFRKVIIVAPLTIILPIYIGIDGVFIAEAISNFIGGGACYITMWLTIGKNLKKQSMLENINEDPEL
ncbi:MATE family efflux transporter [uncultured Thomasclavelia sp.]|uniref:MATE family efflux transporter n=1 Tax=uncultured Thomasclavelia sp. TaxID=3025759 RepID=UPI0025E0E829|nr:MATE family efflux transporter [uncultured Thomasclavelia sp.]